MGDKGELLKLSSCRQGSQLWWNGISFMLSQLLLHIYINCAIALVDFDLLNLMGLEDLINIYMYIISQTSTCLCVPRHTMPWHTPWHDRHMAPVRPSPCRNRTRAVAADQVLSQPSGFALAYLAVLFVAEPNTHGATFLSQGSGGRDIPGPTVTGRGRHALVLSSAGRCCDRNAVSCVPVSILTHRLHCCLVEIEAPCCHAPGTPRGESPICQCPAHNTA